MLGKQPAARARQFSLRLSRLPSVAPDETAADTGRLLQAARERLGLSRTDVNRDLRISRTQIARMEAGQFARVSAVPALRDGHVRAYTQYLGLDLGPVLEAVRRHSDGNAEADPEPLYPPSPRRNPLAYVMMGVSMVLLILLVMAWDRLSSVPSYLRADGVEAAGREALAAVPSNAFLQLWSARGIRE